MDRREVIDVCRRHRLAPNKKLGQNFLVSEAIAGRIIESLRLTADDDVLEVGPGLGALTGRIAAAAGSCTAVEIDAGLTRALHELLENTGAAVIHADFLKANIEDGFSVIVSNLPYYCSSEMLFRFAADFSAPRVYVMVQREMAGRIMAKPGTKAYGALTVTLGFHFDATVLFPVPRGAFYPVPDVHSSFLSLTRVVPPPFPDRREAALFHGIVKSAFWGRRKTLVKALGESPHLTIPKARAAAVLARMGLGEGIRGEMLGLDDFIRLTRHLAGSDQSDGGGG